MKGTDPSLPEHIHEGPIIAVGQRTFRRLLVRTPMIHQGTDLEEMLRSLVRPWLEPSDLLVMSEKVVAISQGRLAKGDDIAVRPLAHFLSARVMKSPHGLGHRNPLVMEMALREAGTARILLAAAVGGLTKRLLGRSGDFYRVAGRRVAAIDGTNRVTIPPYGDYVVLMPTDPEGTARRFAAAAGGELAIVDVNDVGAEVLGASAGVDRELVRQVTRDNPLGQGHQQTPVGIVRPTREAG